MSSKSDKESTLSSLVKDDPPPFEDVVAERPVHVEDVWSEVRALERHHLASRRYRHISGTIEPVIDFLSRFTPVVDTFAQYGSSSAALIWGSLKAVLVIAQKSVNYFHFIDKAMVKLGDTLSISREYERMFVEEARVRVALSDLHNEIYLFLEKIRKSVTVSSWRILTKNIMKSFDSDFSDNISHIERYTRIFNDEITLAHRQRLNSANKQLQMMVKQSSLDNATLVNMSESREADEIKNSALRWLAQMDPSEDFQRVLTKRFPGTGNWLLNNESMKSWVYGLEKPSDAGILWVNGRAGSGKSVLSAVVLEHLMETRKAPVTYFYCDSGDVQMRSALNVCGAILSQLTVQMGSLPPSILEAYGRAKKYGRQHISASDNLFTVLSDVISSLPGAYIILDGIDECDDAAEFTKSFADIARGAATLRLAFFSRKLPAIQNELEGATSIPLETNFVQEDIDKYLSESLKVPGRGTDAHDYVLRRLSQAADGMFLFASLGVQSVRQAVDSKSLIEAVNNIPAGLDGIYGRALDKIGSQSLRRRDLARKILIWVCCSTRPLTWKELQMALSWDNVKEQFVEDQRPFKDVVLELCVPLVEYRANKDTFHVTHFSVRGFLYDVDRSLSLSAVATQFLIKEVDAHRQIAEIALGSLTIPEVIHSTKVEPRQYPLVQYSTENWCFHLASSSFDSKLCKKYEQFVALPQTRATWILRFLISNKKPFPLQRLAKFQQSVHSWRTQSDPENRETTFTVDDLADIQRAIIELDQLPESANHGEQISNFERNIIIRDLARAYTMVGKLDQGIQLFSSALSRIIQTRGDQCLEVAWLLNSIGILYDQQGLTELAASTQLRALEIQQNQLPPDHLDIVLTANELGRMSRHLGKFREAEAYHLRALSALRKVLPEPDLQVIWTINTLARSYRKEGRPEEALFMHRQALSGQKKLLGNEHPHTLWTMGDIARCMRDLGDTTKALGILREVHDGRVMTLGPLNPDTLWTLNDIGLLLESMNKIDDAIAEHGKALEGQTKVMGKDHAHTLWTAERLEGLRASTK
ncbi:hypothetical protein F5882DRAFT_453880 [Hyaloscypha sp. PMI_1271]|nr:hypothetical protein F5882DRAFT_453880 [Hyaloscypha sp. PMI_1271]